MKKVGIINSGGDCAGLNAVMASVVKAGEPLGYEFVGFEKGWEGLLSPMKYRTLDRGTVKGITTLGGTILGTVNRGRFGAKKGAGNAAEIPDEILIEAKKNLDTIGCEGLIVIGGDGTLSGALQLARKGVNIVGVPKTIDNDLGGTDRTFGFSTAAQVVVDAMDRLHTTASSHGRLILVETMGRHAGWIALRAGLSGGSDAILLPEFPFSVDNLVEFLRDRMSAKGFAVVTIAEGAEIDNKLVGEGTSGEVHLGGVAHELAKAIQQRGKKDEQGYDEFEIRSVVLGHIQRGGTPNSADRALAQSYGVAAINAYHRGDFNKMVAYRNLQMTMVPIEEAVGKLKRVTPESLEYQVARQLGIFVH